MHSWVRGLPNTEHFPARHSKGPLKWVERSAKMKVRHKTGCNLVASHTNKSTIMDSDTSVHTTSVFSLNTPPVILSGAIYLKGSFTLSSLPCLKYPVVYTSSDRPKSATLMFPPASSLMDINFCIEVKQTPVR